MKKLAVGLGLVALAGAAIALLRRRRSDPEDLSWSPTYAGEGERPNDAVELEPDVTPDEQP
jgi:hypothetical protein